MNSVTDDLIINEFIQSLENKFPDVLEEIILYGSRARGDFREYSDYDFLIIYKDSGSKDLIQDAVLDAEVLVMDKYDRLASSLLWSHSDWERKKKYPLGLNIQKEGKNLWKKKNLLSLERLIESL